MTAGFFGGEGSSSDDDDTGSDEEEEEGMELSAMRPMTPSQIPSEILAEKKAAKRNGRGALPMERPRELSSLSTGRDDDPWAFRRKNTEDGTEMRMMDPMPEGERPQPSKLLPIPSWRFKFVLACPIRSVPRSSDHLSPFTSPAKPPKSSSLFSRSTKKTTRGGGEREKTTKDGDGTLSSGRRRRASLKDEDVSHWAVDAAAAAAAVASSDTVSSTSTTSTVTGDEGGDGEKDDEEEEMGMGMTIEEEDFVDVDWPVTFGEQHVLQWETDLLANLGADMMGFSATNTVGTAAVSTAMSTVLATAILPGTFTVLESVSSLDNPWSVASARVEAAGAQLAEVLLARVHGERPVTLIGYSMGARLIFHALLSMAEHYGDKARGLVEDAVLLGGTMSTDPEEWTKVRSVVCGRLVNGHSNRDWLLALMYRYKSWNLSAAVAGLGPVEDVRGVENVDLSRVIGSHTDYPRKMARCLQIVG